MATEDTTTSQSSSSTVDTSIIEKELVPFDNYKPHTLNYTDIRVWHDPLLAKQSVAKINTDQDKQHDEQDGVSSVYSDVDNKKIDGIWEPVIQVNNNVLDSGMISMMIIDYNTFLPQLTLKIDDDDEKIKNFDIGGMNSNITVIFTPSTDGGYRKVSLTFEVTDTQTYGGGKIIYYGKLNVPAFNDNNIGSITFDGDEKIKFTQSGCVTCPQATNRICNFWELLHVIASYSKLGFGSTNNCKEINDRLPRNIRNQHWDEYIEEQLEFAGIDENSIFDAWVDLYGYIDLVNVAYVMNEEVKDNELGIHPEVGLRFKSQSLPEVKLEKYQARVLHNFHNAKDATNMFIESYEMINNNGQIKDKGTFRNVRIFGLESTGGNNSLTEYQNLIVEGSLNGMYYNGYGVDRDANIEMSFNDDYYSTVKQKMLRESYFDKLRAHVMKVKLTRINLGLERGELVEVVIFDGTTVGKHIIAESTTGVYNDQSSGGLSGDNIDMDKPDLTTEGKTRKDMQIDNTMSLPNMALTGFYYIDGMQFTYNKDVKEIQQYLYLIKKPGNLTNYYDNFSRVDYDLVPQDTAESSSTTTTTTT